MCMHLLWARDRADQPRRSWPDTPCSSYTGHKGYDLYVDHYYTSPTLAAELTKVGITVTGTLQTRVPTAVEQGCKQPVGTVSAFQSQDSSGDILVLTWMDKRKIVTLFTKHKVGMVLMRTRQVQYYNASYSTFVNMYMYAHTYIHAYVHMHT